MKQNHEPRCWQTGWLCSGISYGACPLRGPSGTSAQQQGNNQPAEH
jgi:hypothetical protein